jgi:hypothetical protein
MEIGYPATSGEENRQESFKRHVPTTYRTFYGYDPAVTANGPFQLKAGPESRQKNTN